MSYCRNPFYIWESCGENEGDPGIVHFWRRFDPQNGTFSERVRVPNDMLDAFLYKLLLSENRDDLRERLRAGRRVFRQDLPPERRDAEPDETITGTEDWLFWALAGKKDVAPVAIE